MKSKRIISSLLPLCLAITSVAVQADTRYVSSVKAKVLQEPNFASTTLIELTKGETLDVLNAKGTWLNVKTNEKTGWISKFLVAETPPIDKITVLSGEDETELKDVRRRTSAITTAAAARGLAARSDEQDTQYTKNMAGVQYMESFKVSAKELQAFEQFLLNPVSGGAKWNNTL